ncbi:hypothetical protein NX059_001278 [Plenodomus lindquistii]|nr:hypothetical protein NX059_001278 [Plenodomus lindquistii]
MALSTASNWFWNFLLAFFTPFITGDIGFRYGYVFAGTNVIGGLIVYFFVIEGQGRTLEEIDTMYLMGVKPWESAKWVVPSLDEMSGELRKRLEEANPELAVKQEMAANGERKEEGGGVLAAEANGARRSSEDGEGSNNRLTEKKDIEA